MTFWYICFVCCFASILLVVSVLNFTLSIKTFPFILCPRGHYFYFLVVLSHCHNLISFNPKNSSTPITTPEFFHFIWALRLFSCCICGGFSNLLTELELTRNYKRHFECDPKNTQIFISEYVRLMLLLHFLE